MHLLSLKLLRLMVKDEMDLQGKHYLTLNLDIWFNDTGNSAQYPLHHVTYAPPKFEVAMSIN